MLTLIEDGGGGGWARRLLLPLSSILLAQMHLIGEHRGLGGALPTEQPVNQPHMSFHAWVSILQREKGMELFRSLIQRSGKAKLTKTPKQIENQ